MSNDGLNLSPEQRRLNPLPLNSSSSSFIVPSTCKVNSSRIAASVPSTSGHVFNETPAPPPRLIAATPNIAHAPDTSMTNPNLHYAHLTLSSGHEGSKGLLVVQSGIDSEADGKALSSLQELDSGIDVVSKCPISTLSHLGSDHINYVTIDMVQTKALSELEQELRLNSVEAMMVPSNHHHHHVHSTTTTAVAVHSGSSLHSHKVSKKTDGRKLGSMFLSTLPGYSIKQRSGAGDCGHLDNDDHHSEHNYDDEVIYKSDFLTQSSTHTTWTGLKKLRHPLRLLVNWFSNRIRNCNNHHHHHHHKCENSSEHQCNDPSVMQTNPSMSCFVENAHPPKNLLITAGDSGDCSSKTY